MRLEDEEREPGPRQDDAIAPLPGPSRPLKSLATPGGRLRWTLLILILLGFLLRVVRLQFQPLWWDEGYSVWFATHSLGAMAAMTAQDIHPPLYYALLHGWTSLLGTGPVALRLLSVAAGILMIPAVYLAGRRMFSTRAALLAALLAALSPLAIFYSQEIRMYGLVALLSTGVLLAAWRVLAPAPDAAPGPARRPGGIPCPVRAYLPYVVLMTAALYTQYYAVFLLAGLTLFALWRWWRDRNAPSQQNVILSGPAPNTVQSRQDSEESRAEAPRTSSQSDTLRPANLAGHEESANRPQGVSAGELPTDADGAQDGPVRGKSPKSRANAALGCWLAAQAAVALLFLPWVLYAGPRLVPYVSQKVVQDADRPLGLFVYLARHLSAFLAGHLEAPLAPYWPVALLLLIPIALGLVWTLWPAATGSASRDRDSGNHTIDGPPNGQSAIRQAENPGPQSAIIMLLLVLASALLLGWAVGLRYPFFPERGERLLLLALPALLLLAAAALDTLPRRAPVVAFAALGLSIAVSVAGLASFYTTPRYVGNDYRPLIARVIEQGLPGDTFLAVYPWQAGYWRAYGDPNGATDLLIPSVTWGAPVISALESALESGRVWFPAHLSLGGMLEERIEDYLGSRSLAFVNEWHGPNTRLSAWAITPPAAPVEITPARFALPGESAGALELTAAAAQSTPIPAANTVMPLNLTWSAESAPPVLDVSVRLTDDLGRIWAQNDYEPLGGIAAADADEECDVCADKASVTGRPWRAQDRLGLLIPAGTPPGRYHVELVLLPKDDTLRLSVLDESGRLLGVSARLFDITVAPADRPLLLENLPIETRREVQMEGGLSLLGFSMGDKVATPGDDRKINLFWRTDSSPTGEYTAFVQLLDGNGQVASGWEAPPGGGYPTQTWEPGALIRTQAAIQVPADLPDGRYRVIAGLFRSDDETRIRTAHGDDAVELGRLTVRGRSHDLVSPNPAYAQEGDLDALAHLLGYDLTLPADGISPGDTFPLALYWQAMGASPQPFTVFVHLVDDSGAILGGGDSEPGAGRFPTTGWLDGEYLTDAHAVAVRPDAPSGTYLLVIGLYNPATGERLKTADGADHITLETPIFVR